MDADYLDRCMWGHHIPSSRSRTTKEKVAWLEAARTGNDELVAQLLAECPDRATDTLDSQTALHHAAKGGQMIVVARLLAACPDLINIITQDDETPLHFAAEEGHDGVAAQLLAAAPGIEEGKSLDGLNALHYAAQGGHDKIVALILAVRFSLIANIDKRGSTALRFAAKGGHMNVFARLLAAYPELIDKDPDILQAAARGGNDDMVAQILALRPNSISNVDCGDWTALMYAVFNGHLQIVERLLALRPEEVNDVSGELTLLHAAVIKCPCDFVARLWRMNPQALHVSSSSGNDRRIFFRMLNDPSDDAVVVARTPFHYAILAGREDVQELFQWSLSIDEIVGAFTSEHVSLEERCRPLMEAQCGLESLNRDEVATVFEYLGFEPRGRPPRKRARDHERVLMGRLLKSCLLLLSLLLPKSESIFHWPQSRARNSPTIVGEEPSHKEPLPNSSYCTFQHPH